MIFLELSLALATLTTLVAGYRAVRRMVREPLWLPGWLGKAAPLRQRRVYYPLATVVLLLALTAIFVATFIISMLVLTIVTMFLVIMYWISKGR